MAELVSLDEVRAAAVRVRGVTVRTPLVPLPAAMAGAGAAAESLGKPRLLIKPESLQPTGAFKLRGAYNAISALPASAKANGVVAHSSGNHGFAVAYAAALLGVKAAIVVPDNAAKIKIDAIRQTGAELVQVQPTRRLTASSHTRAAITASRSPTPPHCLASRPRSSCRTTPRRSRPTRSGKRAPNWSESGPRWRRAWKGPGAWRRPGGMPRSRPSTTVR